jgi:Tol biopolymer transport system component/DNA-binding winged helix-turn-helix (wHTH) protein
LPFNQSHIVLNSRQRAHSEDVVLAVQGKQAKIWRFGVFEVDASNPALRRSGTSLKIREQTFRILVFLLEHAGEVVSREDLRRVLWPTDTFVDFDHSLNTAMMNLRDVLGDVADSPIYIATIPKRGYRFLAPVEVISADGAGVAKGAARELAEPSTKEDSESLDSDEVSKSTFRWMAMMFGLVVLGVVAIYLIRGKNTGVHENAIPLFSSEKTKTILSVPGIAGDMALSPDGRQLAFVWSVESQPQSNVYVQLVGEDQRLQLTHYTGGYVCCTSWSPDGSHVAYGRCEDDGAGVFVVPALGGPERKITDVMCEFGTAGFPQWTDGGRTLVLADRCTPGAPRGIVAFSLETGQRRCLASPPAGGDENGDGFPLMSPDQKTVAFTRDTTLEKSEIYAVDLSGKHLRQLTKDREGISGPLMWAPDGKHILFRAGRLGGTFDICQVPVAGGPIEAATYLPGLGSLSNDGRLLAYYAGGGWGRSTTWQVRLKSPGGNVLSAKPITGGSLFQDSPQLSQDATHLVTRSLRGSHGGLWKSDIDGNNYVLVEEPPKPAIGSPHWSPDAKWIAMDGRFGYHSQIYSVDSEGRNFHVITSGDHENEVPRWSRDGRSIYFSSNRTGEWQLWRRNMTTGHETQITKGGGISAFESYDGSSLYYAKLDSGGLWRRPVDGGTEERISGDLHLGYWGAYAVTEPGIYLIDGDVLPRPSIVFYDFKTRRTKPVLALDHLPAQWVPSITASRDGLLLFFSQLESGETVINLAERAR